MPRTRVCGSGSLPLSAIHPILILRALWGRSPPNPPCPSVPLLTNNIHCVYIAIRESATPQIQNAESQSDVSKLANSDDNVGCDYEPRYAPLALHLDL